MSVSGESFGPVELSIPHGWAGVGVGKGHHWVCLIDEAGTTVWSSKVGQRRGRPPRGDQGCAVSCRSGELGCRCHGHDVRAAPCSVGRARATGEVRARADGEPDGHRLPRGSHRPRESSHTDRPIRRSCRASPPTSRCLGAWVGKGRPAERGSAVLRRGD